MSIYKLIGLSFISIVFSTCSIASECVTEAMLEIVMTSESMTAAEDTFKLVTEVHNWKAKISTGIGGAVSEIGNKSTSDPYIGLHAEIPLFDRSHDLKKHEARIKLMDTQDNVLSTFYKDMDVICQAQDAYQSAIDLWQLLKDQLEYQQKLVQQGQEDPKTLWTNVKDLRTAANDLRVKAKSMNTNMASIARRYGESRWQELLNLLKLNAPTMTPPAPTPSPTLPEPPSAQPSPEPLPP